MKARARSTSIPPVSIAVRRKHMRIALGNAALEGIKPRPQALADLKAVTRGTLTTEQYRKRVKERYGVRG